MRTSLLSLLLPVCALAYTDDDYKSGRVHQKIVDLKQASFAKHAAAGDYDSNRWPSWDKFLGGRWRSDVVRCVNGQAVAEPGNPRQTFKCKDIDMYDFKSHADLGSPMGQGSDTFGWVAPNGREFVAICQADGTAFAEITRQGKLAYLGRMPHVPGAKPSIWHDVKGYKSYMVIGSEADNHGVQIFDMRKLLNIDARNPKLFSTDKDLTGFFNELPVGRSHNIVINNERGYGVAVGAAPRNSTCAAGLIFIDFSDISKPTSPGCASGDGYVHDAQCVVYKGPDRRYTGRDICYGYNEDTLTIYDVTNKKGTDAAKIISRTAYTGATYTHQGWLLDENWQDFLMMGDELDEEEGNGPAADGYAITYIFDISDLEKPKNTGYYRNTVKSIDHNLYITDGLATESNYGSGLRVLDVSGIREDPSGKNVEEVAFFDIYPEDDTAPGGGVVEFVGTWAHYPWFPSGYIFVNTIERGGFVVKMNKFPGKAHGRKWGIPGKWFSRV